jgi:telomere length regulation protein
VILYLPSSSATLRELTLSGPFIQSIGTYIGHLDPSVRRCGMLVAEEVAHRTGKELDFKDRDGDDGGKLWVREVCQLFADQDLDAQEHGLDVEEILEEDAFEPPDESTQDPQPPVSLSEDYDSGDSLTGYAASSSRSPSPTLSELAEVERDPSLRVGKAKIVPPVYLAQLGEMIRSTSGLKTDQESQEAEKVGIARNVAEELIRRKRGYGTELGESFIEGLRHCAHYMGAQSKEENAVNLVHALVGLHDNYDLDGFDIKRQAALNALVACCPQKAVP